MVAPVMIADRRVGPGAPVFIIAEAGVNHNGNVGLAKRLIDAAALAGADAAKFQTFRAERLVSPLAPKAAYQRSTTDAAESQLDMIRKLELPPEAFRELQTHSRARGIVFLSTPCDEASADLLGALDVPAFKIGSGELTNWPFLAHVARKGKPMIVSTGMGRLDEVADAVRVIREAGRPPLVLLHCVSSYPADPSEANLRAMYAMAEAFQVPVGYSDHTQGLEVALAAAALGACVIEKHLTLDRALPGPDHRASLDPEELAGLVRGIRRVEAALGHGRKEPSPSEADTAVAARKSLVAAKRIAAGSPFTEDAIVIQRPGTGLAPGMLSRVIGRTAAQDIPAGSPLTMDMVR